MDNELLTKEEIYLLLTKGLNIDLNNYGYILGFQNKKDMISSDAIITNNFL